MTTGLPPMPLVLCTLFTSCWFGIHVTLGVQKKEHSSPQLLPSQCSQEGPPRSWSLGWSESISSICKAPFWQAVGFETEGSWVSAFNLDDSPERRILLNPFYGPQSVLCWCIKERDLLGWWSWCLESPESMGILVCVPRMHHIMVKRQRCRKQIGDMLKKCFCEK